MDEPLVIKTLQHLRLWRLLLEAVTSSHDAHLQPVGHSIYLWSLQTESGVSLLAPDHSTWPPGQPTAPSPTHKMTKDDRELLRICKGIEEEYTHTHTLSHILSVTVLKMKLTLYFTGSG